MSAPKFTPAPWFVRTLPPVVADGESPRDCFVAAKDVLGYPYDAEILGDDEYHDGITRKLADCNLIAAAPDLYAACVRDAAVEPLLLAAGVLRKQGNDNLADILERKHALERAALAKARGEA